MRGLLSDGLNRFVCVLGPRKYTINGPPHITSYTSAPNLHNSRRGVAAGVRRRLCFGRNGNVSSAKMSRTSALCESNSLHYDTQSDGVAYYEGQRDEADGRGLESCFVGATLKTVSRRTLVA